MTDFGIVQNGGGDGVGGGRDGGGKSRFGFWPAEPVGFGGGRGDASVDIPLENMSVRASAPSL
jgi:secretory carrier-associated membrane protein